MSILTYDRIVHPWLSAVRQSLTTLLYHVQNGCQTCYQRVYYAIWCYRLKGDESKLFRAKTTLSDEIRARKKTTFWVYMVHRHVYYLNSFSLENPDMNILLFSGRQLNLWTCGILLHLNLQTCFYSSHSNNIFLTLKPAFISLKIIHSISML